MTEPSWYDVVNGDFYHADPVWWHPGCPRSPSWGRDDLWSRDDGEDEPARQAPLMPVSVATCSHCGVALPDSWPLVAVLPPCWYCGLVGVTLNLPAHGEAITSAHVILRVVGSASLSARGGLEAHGVVRIRADVS